MQAVHTLHTDDPEEVKKQIAMFIGKHGQPEAFLSGENGDVRMQDFYDQCKSLMDEDVLQLRFKHFTGEHPTANAMAFWLAGKFLGTGVVPQQFILRAKSNIQPASILIYNTGKGEQHSFIFLTK